MMVNRRKRAIRLLSAQKKQIDIIQIYTFGKWKAQTDAIVKQYIGNTDFHRQKFTKVDMSILPMTKDSEDKKKKWLKAQKALAKEYVDSCIQYLNNGGVMVIETSWFCKRTVGEIIAMVAILLSIVLPYTCNQGKIQGATNAEIKIHQLEVERDTLKKALFNCINDLSKIKNRQKDTNE